jgi:hypothetical protein
MPCPNYDRVQSQLCSEKVNGFFFLKHSEQVFSSSVMTGVRLIQFAFSCIYRYRSFSDHFFTMKCCQLLVYHQKWLSYEVCLLRGAANGSINNIFIRNLVFTQGHRVA